MCGRERATAGPGRGTLNIIDTGGYTTPGGATVDLTDWVRAAVDRTRLYLPGGRVPPPRLGGAEGLATGAGAVTPAGPAIEVTRESTLVATRPLACDGEVAALVFASAKNAGGGFLTGAQAQEESLARASALFTCLAPAR